MGPFWKRNDRRTFLLFTASFLCFIRHVLKTFLENRCGKSLQILLQCSYLERSEMMANNLIGSIMNQPMYMAVLPQLPISSPAENEKLKLVPNFTICLQSL